MAAPEYVGWAPPTISLIRSQHAGWDGRSVYLCRLQLVGGAQPTRTAFTLVEMLIAMAITLVMMAAVVTLFANVSNGVRNRRATIEMSGQLRGVRNMLQQDLQGATCPGITWQRSESNHGYIEIIEGVYREGNASNLIDGIDLPERPDFNPEIDHATSILPSSNLPFTSVTGQASWATDGAGLGDYDDILMLTVRNEHEPFVGRTPTDVGDTARNDGDPDGFGGWEYKTIESPLAEVVWFAIENPEEASNTDKFFGEPGMRTIYRRTLLIAPWVNPYKELDNDDDDIVNIDTINIKVTPGLVRVLPIGKFAQDRLDDVFAALIAFQDRYDLSVRVEWDAQIKRWKIVANTLADLTKRENRYGHFGFFPGEGTNPPIRVFPYAAVSWGSGYDNGRMNVIVDPEVGGPATPAKIEANLSPGDTVVSYTVDEPGAGYATRPFVYVDEDSQTPATAQAMLNDDGEVVRVIHGPVPLWGTRRGEDVMMSDVLAFDLRVYDPGALLFLHRDSGTVLKPDDPGWKAALEHENNMDLPGGWDGFVGQANSDTNVEFPYIGQGEYVDMGYGHPYAGYSFAPSFSSSTTAWFFTPRALSDVYGRQLAPGYAVYDTWSFHYENNGINEDADEVENGVYQFNNGDNVGIPLIDEGTNGLDDFDHRSSPPVNAPDSGDLGIMGADDVGERETAPPYDKPLRGMQVIIRTYERDARSIRQLRVNQHFMLE